MTQPAPANWRSVCESSRAALQTSRPPSAKISSRRKSQRSVKPSRSSALTLGISKARVTVDTATPEQLETQLQTLLRDKFFVDAAFLIAASPHLSKRFQTSDVARLMLQKHVKSFHILDQVAQLVRDFQLQQHQDLVTLLINEMVRALQFTAAVSLAQEMVPGFELQGGGAAAAVAKDTTTMTSRPCWTPSALIQAMLRAKRYRAALKYSKQFGLLDTFPASQLVAGMLETRCWEEAVSSVMEMQLFTEFPLEALAVEMMQHRQWSQAVKCMNKMSVSDETRAKLYEALVREIARVGDFVTALRYLREFKLDQGYEDATMSLLRYLVDSMLAYGAFYKAIKYAIKFKLARNPLHDAIAAANAVLAASDGEEMPCLPEDDHVEYLPQYNVENLIRKAIDGGQFHVATTYIKRLRLREKFEKELVAIEQAQQNRLLEFRQYATLRLAQFQDAARQQNHCGSWGDQSDDEMVELEPVDEEIVLSEKEEFFPHKKPQQVEDEEDESKAIKEGYQAPVSESNGTGITKLEFNVSAVNSDESRFGFARATSPLPPPLPSDPVFAVKASGDDGDIQPRIESFVSVKPTPPPDLYLPEGQPVPDNTHDDAGGVDGAEFAKSCHVNGPRPPPQPPTSNQQVQAMFPRSMPSGQFASGPPGYPMPPMMQPQNHVYYPQGNMPPGAMQPRSYMQPPLPPSPPPPSPSNDEGAFDVAALAMQFHNGGRSSGSSGFRGFVSPRPPMGYSGIAPNGQHQQIFPGIPPVRFSARPPQPTFKPSMSYTSVTTTRQKK